MRIRIRGYADTDSRVCGYGFADMRIRIRGHADTDSRYTQACHGRCVQACHCIATRRVTAAAQQGRALVLCGFADMGRRVSRADESAGAGWRTIALAVRTVCAGLPLHRCVAKKAHHKIDK